MHLRHGAPDSLSVAKTSRRVRDDDRDNPDGAREEHPCATPAVPRPDPLRWDGGSASDRAASGRLDRARPGNGNRLTSINVATP